ncbi:RiPP maturation radical SAM C-methyltransferase [Nonomuraea sp. K274]|uniref:RiPP maturation radical SAM C-methyltransferase n=1 Tax=Nonomuraea cypriaca TaxID=1187855 RepID=A0A931AKP6_9ACTN|nr:RiPP maturation radical SAM C-methyltransferase [Nonomuraea cypriaca]MBF8193708.1 RiPP maturation radical SAM C-methyltransferase [Nonomuraea cypriaca]
MTGSRPPRVLLISMPWHALNRPSLGLSLLQAGLRSEGVACDVRHLGFRLCDAIGLPDYLWVHGELPHLAFAGEWLFTSALYGTPPRSEAEYARDVLGYGDEAEYARDVLGSGDVLGRLRRLRGPCEAFIDDCLESIPWAGYDVVGFTSTFEQNIASLALARRVKQRHPGVFVVFGGANWEGDMGHELHARFPFLDAVCTGEADRSFPALVRTIATGGSPAGVPGVIVRGADGRGVRTPPGPPIADLDALPEPCFDAYFADLAASANAAHIAPRLLLETSRGCWWGARHHCTFCGLNGTSMAYRSKSPERVLAEIEHLLHRHGVTTAAVVDNILDMRYFGTVLPALAAAGAPMELFYEVKANLTAEQVRLLARAGVRRVQPGLESLSDHVLALMRKGTTALRNVQLLKWCHEFGVRPEWNLIYGFPGETAEDYAHLPELVDAIDFLTPPSGMEPVRLDRFSPYHADPAAFGLVNVRPKPVYRHLYPFPGEALERIAYYFDFDHADGGQPDAYAGPALERVRRWTGRRLGGTLALLPHTAGGVVLIDDRDGEPVSCRLTGWRAAVYERCDRVTTERAAVAAGTGEGAEPEEVRAFLAGCRERRLMANVGDRWLALAVRTPPREV